MLQIALTDEREERELIAAFSAERSDEYGEIVERTLDFLREIETERQRGRMTYTEVEESDADFKRFQRCWPPCASATTSAQPVNRKRSPPSPPASARTPISRPPPSPASSRVVGVTGSP
jgi:hypothetical protein